MQHQTHHNQDGKQTHQPSAYHMHHPRVDIWKSVSYEHPRTVTKQPVPQFDEFAKLIVGPVITTGRDKKITIKIANITDSLRDYAKYQTG